MMLDYNGAPESTAPYGYALSAHNLVAGPPNPFEIQSVNGSVRLVVHCGQITDRYDMTGEQARYLAADLMGFLTTAQEASKC